MRFDVFETTRKRGESLREVFADGAWKMTFGNKGEEKEFAAYFVISADFTSITITLLPVLKKGE